MSVFLDANILLEVLLPDRPKAALAEAYAQEQAVVSPLSAHLYAYFGQKEGFSMGELTKHLALLDYTDLGAEEINWAIANLRGDDFEDGLQVACAVLNGCELFVTLDASLAKKYDDFIKMKVL